MPLRIRVSTNRNATVKRSQQQKEAHGGFKREYPLLDAVQEKDEPFEIGKKCSSFSLGYD